jgi:hypothetical protein
MERPEPVLRLAGRLAGANVMVAKNRSKAHAAPPGAPIGALALKAELAGGSMRPLTQLSMGGLTADIVLGLDSLWVLMRREGKGGLAFRAAFAPGGLAGRVKSETDSAAVVAVASPLGQFDVSISMLHTGDPLVRVQTTLTPSADLLLPFLPRDLYPLDNHDNPLAAVGRVDAAQRGLNSGLVYFSLDQPAFGNVLYFQNLTALNDYFRLTKTKPDGVVGGEWPELGYQPPTAPLGHSPPIEPLPAGKPVIISDALMTYRAEVARDERESAEQFLDMLGQVYSQLDKPKADFRDWAGRAEKTLKDLQHSPKASLLHYGHRYIHPYTASEYPDSMVQMTVLSSIMDYAVWKGKPIPFGDELAEGMGKFYDPKLQGLRRYLPNVGKDKDKDAVDSWYLYHPVMNMGRLALAGDARFKRLFLKSVEFGIKAARHFDYAWPIQFKVQDFAVITEARNDDGLGQTDVGGLYAYVMLQAYQLTADDRFLAEAKAAIDAAEGMRFELNYQANLTAWGAVACMRLWRISQEPRYLKQSYVYLASFFHNCEIWESQIEHARHYRNFLGATCLHDAPYMAIYEGFESFAAFEQYLKESGPELSPHLRLLVTEYCKYALDRAWFYYPDALPAEILATDIRNGHIDATLSFPLEDLYGDGQSPGQVGQEIYGSGAAFIYASKSFHNIPGAPFRLFCDHFMVWSESGERSFRFRVAGGEDCNASFSLLLADESSATPIHVQSGHRTLGLINKGDGRLQGDMPVEHEVHISW